MWKTAFIVLFIITMVLFLLLWLMRNEKSDGRLKIDLSDPDKDSYLMEFDIPLDDIPKKKTLKIDVVQTTIIAK